MPANAGCVAPADDLVPADVRQRRRIASSRTVRPARIAKRLGAVLVAALEQQLEAEADPEERAIGRRPRRGSASTKPALAQPLHRGRGRADAGDDEQVRRRRCRRAVSCAAGRGAPAATSACSIETRLPAP